MITIAKKPRAKELSNQIDFELAVDRASYVETELRLLSAERDAAVQRAQQTHAGALAALADELKAKLAQCERYATAHRAELMPKERKSAETPLSIYGFRTGMPTLKLVPRMTWEKVLENLERAKFASWVRTKKEVAKDAMLSALQCNPAVEKTLAGVGVRFAQKEHFYVEPKTDGATPMRGGE
ncbi:MAG: host-nuclease inhibitor Gam family protein [Moraxellaceae bacterium]|nr:host-nuclease inhibitor Gam family protein [Moraxellaceae bacterium]